MRLPYETPKVTVVGSVKDLTQALQISVTPDATLGIPITGPPIQS